MQHTLRLRDSLFACALAASLSACGASQGSIPPASAERPAAHQAGSQGELLYVGSLRHVEMYAYPDGTHEGTFKPLGRVHAMCADADGNVFIAESSGDTGHVDEYEHGGKAPIATLALPAHDIPASCSSDPAKENLAVAVYDARNFAPSVAIYRSASEPPKIYRSEALGANPQVAYDGDGDLFATSGANLAAVMSKGASRFKTIAIDRTLGGVNHAQWDGKFLALQSFGFTLHSREKVPEQIFRLKIEGTTARVVGNSRFVNWLEKRAGQSWIAGDTVVATPEQKVVFWNYPGGGKAFKVIKPVHASVAVTISAAP